MVKVMVADDSIFIVETLKEYLSSFEVIETVIAINGQSAVEKYKAEKPDIVFMDINMPVLNGISATIQILEYDPKAIVCIFSTLDYYQMKDESLEIGAKAYLEKPINFALLKETIELQLGIKLNHETQEMPIPTGKILVADDSRFMRERYKTVLKEHGFNVVEAENGEVAVEQYQETNPDMVFMDLDMPKMDGVSAVGKIKEIDGSAKIVIVSALEQNSTVMKALKAGAIDFILKPFNPQKVISTVQKVLTKCYTSKTSIQYTKEKKETPTVKEKPAKAEATTAQNVEDKIKLLQDQQDTIIANQKKLFELIESMAKK